jgi:flagellin
MSFSVNTNSGALVALQYLTATQGQLAQTQSHINSGLKVATARDDGAIYAIAQNQRASVAGYTAVVNSINNGTSAIDVALSAGQSISDC